MLTADKIAETNADRGTRIKVHMLADDEVRSPLVVFEGDSAAMKMMSDLFLAMSELAQKSHFSMGPDCAGSVVFTRGSDCGFYINRI